MKNKAIVLLLLVAGCGLLYGFVNTGKYFIITKEDVELHIPKGFPKPGYRFKGNKPTPEKFVLGRMLFYDPILSKDSTTSCASCHQRIAAFGHIDHALSHGINGLKGNRNVPALQNLIWEDTYMWDGRVDNLVQQPINPITNPIEMDESFGNIISKLSGNNEYAAAFKTAFGDTAVTQERILKALAQFTGLMVSANSRYDKYTNGEDTFSASEKNGLALFRAKCATCHQEPLFTDNSFRNNGLKPDTALHDKGRGGITNHARDNNKFRVPSLRNIEMTYPYMHDGRMRKLTDVMNHYANPAGFAPGADEDLKKIGALTEKDKKDIIAFLLTLTDKTFLYDRRFIDPFMR